MRKFYHLALFICSASALIAQTPPQFQFPPSGFPRVEILEPSATGASAVFAGAARVGRPVEFRVTVVGVTRLTELPLIPEVDGLIFQAAGRTMMAGGVTTYRFTAIPMRAGTFTVPSFEIAVGDNKVTIPKSQLEVAEALAGDVRYQPLQSLIDLPKRNFYVGETIAGRLLFVETPDESPTFVQHVAKTTGTAVFQLDNTTRSVEVEVNGEKRRALAKPIQITPLKEGDMEVNCQVIVHVQKRDISNAGRGFAMQVQSTVDVPSVKLRILPLPKEGKPPGFTGAIGSFQLAAPKLSATEVEMGEPITLAISLTGEGNLAGVSAPELPQNNPDWQTYKPTTDFAQPNDETAPLLATKTFTYTLVPKHANARGTPAIPFSYFDPVKGVYVDITIPPQPIKVKASAAAQAAPAETKSGAENPAETETASGPKAIEPALTGLAEATGMWSKSLRPFLWSPWFLIGQLAPPLILIALWALKKRRDYLAANPQIIRRKKARTAARVALAEARIAARRGDQSAFLAASTRALREAASPLDTAQSISLTQEEVLHVLRDDERASATAKSIFESAEARRYGAEVSLKPERVMPDLEHTLARLSAKS